jgi:hypothetical protein
MPKAIDYIKEQYVTESELIQLLMVDAKRIRDLRSNHVTGKRKFIDHIKPTSKSILYRLEDVLQYLEGQKVNSFGNESPD